MEFKKAEVKRYLECAKAVGIHGVKGAVKLECRADSPEVLSGLKTLWKKNGDEYISFKVKSASVHKGMVLACFEGIETPEEAIDLRDTVFFADREDFHLKKGDFFIADIIGLPVFDVKTGERLGELSDVLSPVGRPVYVIRKKNGKTFMVPAVSEFIKQISFGEDSDAGIYVKLIEGMNDEN